MASFFSEVHTERLMLRQPRIEDGLAMFAVHGDPATNRYNPSGLDPDLATSEEGLREWLHYWKQEGLWLLGNHAVAVAGYPGFWWSKTHGMV